jgi:hypothetical protein
VAPILFLPLLDSWNSVSTCRWLHSEENLNTDRDNNNNSKMSQDKGKKAIIQQKAQTKIWQARENPLDVGSSLAFAKLVVTSKITVSATVIEQFPEQQALPTVIVRWTLMLSNPKNAQQQHPLLTVTSLLRHSTSRSKMFLTRLFTILVLRVLPSYNQCYKFNKISLFHHWNSPLNMFLTRLLQLMVSQALPS